VVSSEFLQIAEGLSHLDPIRTYPDRAAKLVADLVNASAYRVEFQKGDSQQRIYSTPPPPPSGTMVSLPLRYGRYDLGHIHLYVPEGNDKFDGLDMRLARWGARFLARGLTYTNRMSWPSPSKNAPIEKRVVKGIQNRLERSPLTPREKQVVSMLVAGCSTKAIAGQAGLTVATVHTYLKRIYSKLGIHSRVELVARMTGTEGVTSMPPPVNITEQPPLEIEIEPEDPEEQN
jgi:DNA-binding CsgD family transcriptional regulator